MMDQNGAVSNDDDEPKVKHHPKPIATQSKNVATERLKDEFEDEYLRDYPARRIIETTFTIDEYELIVNNTLARIYGGQQTMQAAVKGIVRLAFNTLIDPQGKQPEDLFFAKHKRFSESWQSVSGRANNKEKPEQVEQATSGAPDDGLPRLQLRPQRYAAPSNQRKAAIGVWAMCHLRAMVHPKEWLHRFFAKKDAPSEIIQDIYGFENPYVFPSFDKDTYELLRVEFSKKKCDPEVLYLFYRGAIILEHIFHKPELKKQRLLLLSVAYGNPHGLRGHGLELYTWFRSAAKGLRISLEQLSFDLHWALSDGPYNERSAQSSKAVLKLIEFHKKYYPDDSSRGPLESSSSFNENTNKDKKQSSRSKYFLYARVLDGKFFSYLDSDSQEELCSVLVEICRLKSEAHIPEGKVSALWKERAQFLAKKICQRHAKQAGNVVTTKVETADKDKGEGAPEQGATRRGRPEQKLPRQQKASVSQSRSKRATSAVKNEHHQANQVRQNRPASQARVQAPSGPFHNPVLYGNPLGPPNRQANQGGAQYALSHSIQPFYNPVPYGNQVRPPNQSASQARANNVAAHFAHLPLAQDFFREFDNNHQYQTARQATLAQSTGRHPNGNNIGQAPKSNPNQKANNQVKANRAPSRVGGRNEVVHHNNKFDNNRGQPNQIRPNHLQRDSDGWKDEQIDQSKDKKISSKKNDNCAII